MYFKEYLEICDNNKSVSFINFAVSSLCVVGSSNGGQS